MDSLYIVIPAYNEEENIQTVIEEWYPVVEKTGTDSRLVVIDDGSKDATYSIMQECQSRYPQFIALTKKNQGHGATILYGYQYALDAGADYVFQTDSDGQTLPGEFPKFWRHRKRAAMIIGKRVHRQDGLSRIVVTRVLRLSLAVIFHVNIPDANTPFRLMRADILAQVLRKVPNQFNLSNVLISVIYHKDKLGVEYLPITFRPRQGGTNSIHLKSIIKMGWKACKDFVTLRKKL